MKTFKDMVEEIRSEVPEIFPWDLDELIEQKKELLLLDVREPYEFEARHIENSINVPRGLLETACDYGYHETHPLLAASREQEIIIICRSGNRSVLAARTMKEMGYKSVSSLKTGIKGWNDSELPLVNLHGETMDPDEADRYFNAPIRKDQLAP